MLIDFHTHYVPPLPDFVDRWVDQRWPSLVVDGDKGQLRRDGRVVRALRPSAWSPTARLEDMEENGIDQQVISPLPPLICDWANPFPAQEWCLQINDGIAEVVAERPGRFHGLGTVPLQHPDRAIAVLERAAAAGLVGVELGTSAGGREFDDPDLRDFFAAAQDLSMLIFVHPLILGSGVEWTPRITGHEVTFGLGMTTDTAIAAAKLVFGGVTEDLPDLKICLAHGGGTFVWALARIEKAWDGTHDRSAADLMANVYVDSVVYRPANLSHLCTVLGARRVVFGTDYPMPAQDDQRASVLQELSGADRHWVAGGTAGQLLTGSATSSVS